MTDDTKIWDEIDQLNRSIDQTEDIDYLYLPEEIRELRHRVIYVHARLEVSIGLAIWGWILEPTNKTVPIEIRQDMGRRFDVVVSDMDFARKLAIAKKYNFFSKDTFGLLYRVNDLRVVFSHPKAHEEDIQKLKNPATYLEALKTLKKAFDEMDREFASVIAFKK